MKKDIWQKVGEFRQADEAREQGIYPYFLPFDHIDGPWARLDGREILMFGSNNYLGLATHPRVTEAAAEAARRHGTSMTGSRMLNGSLELHAELEERLAAFLGKESVLVFTTGYQVNLAACSALLGDGDVAVVDRAVHASIYDGVKLGLAMGARMVRFGHNSAASLEKHLGRIGDDEGVLVLVDGVFSTDGELARLDEILPVVKAHGARILVDDAHGLGVVGPGGRGSVHHFGLEDEVDLIGGTFSKSLASIGGYLAGDAKIIDFIRHRASPFMFAASGAPASIAAAGEALSILEEEPWRMERLQENSRHLADGASSMGFEIGRTETAVISLHLEDDASAVAMWWALLEDHGIYTNPFVAPAVLPGQILLRMSCMATHEREHLDRCLAALEDVGKKTGIIS